MAFLISQSYTFFLFFFLAQKPVNRARRAAISVSSTIQSVPLGVPFYLSCPIDSYHAEYTWRHAGRSSPCLQMLSDCLHLIPSMTQQDYGEHECVSKEKDYTKVVKKYQLNEFKFSGVIRRSSDGLMTENDASARVPQRLWITALAIWVIFAR